MPQDPFYNRSNFDEEEYPPSWKPSTGHFLGGIVMRYSQGTTEYRGVVRDHPIVIIEVEMISGGADVGPGDEVGFWLLHTVALSKFDKIRPQPGERVGIRKVPSPEGKSYHNYIIKVDRAPEDEKVPDFAAYRANASDHGARPSDMYEEDTAPAAAGGGPGAPGAEQPPEDGLPF